MSTEVYEGGKLRERWDDVSRTYTVWNAQGVQTSTRPYTVAENTQADEDARQNAQITDLRARVEALEAYVFKTTPPTDEGDWSADGTYPPGAVVTHDGHTWINQTGAWLNGFYVPGDPLHPFWSQQPDTAPTPWVTGMHLTPGLFVSNGGHVYQWAGPDTPSAPANWAPTGTVSTAAWTFTS